MKLALETHVTSPAINKIEKGDRLPSFPVMLSLAEVFEISLAELTGAYDPSLNERAVIFFKKFGIINELEKDDQVFVLSMINKLNSIK